MLTRKIALGLPALSVGGLSENWLLREAGDLHWSLIGEHFGLPVAELADADGERLLPAFTRARLTAADSLGFFTEHDEGELSGTLAKLDEHAFVSDIRFATPTTSVEVRLLTSFVRRGAGNWLVPGTPRHEGRAPVADARPEHRDFQGEFRALTRLEPDGAPGLYTDTYELNPFADVNAAGLLYFASYPHINDRGERKYVRSVASDGEWAVDAVTLSRDIVYLGNCGLADAVRYRLDGCRWESQDRVVLTSSLLRERDGRPLARLETVKRLVRPEAFAALRGDRAAPVVIAPAPAPPAASSVPPQAPLPEDLETRLLAVLETVLGEPAGSLTADDDLRPRGLDSLSLSEAAVRAEDEIGLEVDPSTLFQAFTVTAMARVLRGERPHPAAAVRAAGPALAPAAAPHAAMPIAVIGMAGRFPGARSVPELWDLLGRDEDAVRDIPADRWDASDHPDLIAKAALLDDVRGFDHEFFSISPREAALMDPQQRLLLETVWATAEDAGCDPTSLAGSRTGVYAGVCHSDYAALIARHAGRDEPHLSVAVSPSLVANRVSYTLGLRGPSVAVDTLCSSSLVAVAQAVAALRSGECDQAFAGGVNVLCDPDRHHAYQRTGVLSPRGRCHTFDEEADGYVRGEGVAALLLKPLDRALADGDRVHAVIRGVAVNHGGQARSFTAPNPDAQADLLVAAYNEAGVDPRTVGYIEAHGTGTRLGDPIEISAMVAAFDRLYTQWGHPRPDGPHCAVGSLKTNIGHLEAAAGIAGMVKVILAMRHRTLPAGRNLSRPNRMIKIDGTPLRLQLRRTAWESPVDGGPLRAGVSSFGMGGTNAHVVLEEGPRAAAAPETAGPVVVPVSARTPQALREAVAGLLEAVRSPDAPPLASIARTLRTGRAVLPYRVAVEASDLGELAARLASVLDSTPDAPVTGPSGAADGLSGARGHGPSEGAEPARTAPDTPLVSLPTYPFSRDQHWVAPVAGAELLTTEWVDARDAAAPDTGDTRRLLVVTTDPRLARTVLGERAVAHVPGDPVPDLAGLGGIVDLVDWSAPEAFVTERIALLQRMLTSNPRVGLRCVHVSGAERSALAGFYRSLSGEFQALHGRTVRVDGGAAELAAAVRAEAATDDRETEIRYEGTRRRRPVVAFAPARTAEDLLAGVDRGAVLITGGLGGIGLHLAAHLADRGARHIVLVGRSRMPVRNQWAALVAAPATDPALRARLTALLALVERGVTLTIRTDALDDVASLRRLIGRVRKQAGGIDAVFHCAGVMDPPASFLSRTPEDISRVLHPKTDGLRVLWSAFGTTPPRLMVLFSSVAGALPRLAAGHLDYAAANGALDDFAAAHDSGEAGCVVRALRWPLWRGVGMGLERTSASGALGIPDLAADDALELLDLALRVTGDAVSLPCRVERGALAAGELFLAPRPTADLPTAPLSAEALPVPGAAPALTVPAPAVPGPAVRTETAAGVAVPAVAVPGDESAGAVAPDWLYALVARTTKVDLGLLGPGTLLGDVGVDSLLMAELVRDLEGILGHPVDPSLLQEHPTLGGLAAALGAPPVGRVPEPTGPAAYEPTGPAAYEPTGPAAPEAVAQPSRAPYRAPSPDGRPTPIAVIGMGCRLPGADDPAQLWEALLAGRDLVTEVPSDRWDVASLYSPDGGPGRSQSKWGGFLDDAALFDPEFFGFDAEAARHLDPLARKALEVSVECLRDAGYREDEVRGKAVGVFVGTRTGNHRAHLQPPERPYIAGVNQNFVAAHISHFLDLTGPNLVVDSACSSSLVSIHLAAGSLASGESSMALAGGVDLLFDEEPYLMLSAGKALSPSGRCRTFDESADGLVPGEGAGMVLLKRLDDALRDGDRVLAVIESSGVNNDGRTMGHTTPSGRAQRALVSDVLTRAGADARTIGYVEAHGTGTMIGDPIELQALTAVHRTYTEDRGYCGIGSVKSTMGHLLSAAGVAGFIKAVQILRHGRIVPTLHCDRPNPRFAFADSPFFPVTRVTDLPPGSRVGVSAFGFGGTNAHVLLGPGAPGEPGRPPLPKPAYRRSRFWRLPAAPGPAAEPVRSARLDLTFP
ncbi:SDR family NAD(P)-dependent oxidoreductase [Streptomyces sp. G-G2]|uniref:SDR family NAD(P)-dependent oxidoreductase n=1 Tax=Streptomyces sp. G-G2 TaxID=3046201 RepID=UPI0024B99EE3|nr:SDR family NAD(P)-dependent oxidoreductase [Streptomyces sp. G-G2]MDJ0380476.1 SDR family NAD(P)-dependent oxidoreductase [Streptomyces sp. G-G2]